MFRIKIMEPYYDENEFEEILDKEYGYTTICGVTVNQASVLRQVDNKTFNILREKYILEQIRYKCPICSSIHLYNSDAEDCLEIHRLES